MTLTATIPRLESGDQLARAEFEERYQAMPEHVKAELIEGVVYVASPVRHKQHSKPNGTMAGFVFVYSVATPGTEHGDNGTVKLDDGNEYQPDVYLRVEAQAGGQSYVDDDDYIQGAPELVIEIAASSAAQDTKGKLRVYERNGAQEYLVWLVYEQRLDWLRLHAGAYVALLPDADGITRSRVFPGLHLDTAALLRGDLARVLAVLNAGVQTPEHAAFVAQLSARKHAQGEQHDG